MTAQSKANRKIRKKRETLIKRLRILGDPIVAADIAATGGWMLCGRCEYWQTYNARGKAVCRAGKTKGHIKFLGQIYGTGLMVPKAKICLSYVQAHNLPIRVEVGEYEYHEYSKEYPW